MAESEFQQLSEKIDNLHALILSSQKDVLNIDECSLLMGISKSHLYRLTSNHEIPFYKPTEGKIYFHREEVEKWLLRNRRSSNDEIEAQAAAYVNK